MCYTPITPHLKWQTRNSRCLMIRDGWNMLTARSDKQSPGWVLRWEVLLSICLASLLSPGCAAGLHGKNALVFDQNPIAQLWVVKGCVFECRNNQQNDTKWCKMIHLPGVFQPCVLSFCWFRDGFQGDDSQRVYRFCVFVNVKSRCKKKLCAAARFALLHFLMENSSKSRTVGHGAISLWFWYGFATGYPQTRNWWLCCCYQWPSKDVSSVASGRHDQPGREAFGYAVALLTDPLDIHRSQLSRPAGSKSLRYYGHVLNLRVFAGPQVGEGSCCELGPFLWK